MTSVSIIVTTALRPDALEETLRSLSAVQIPETWSVELLLVENGSQSGAEQLLHAFPNGYFTAAKYLFEPARGKSRALNLALAHATGDILLFSDDDIRFPVDWLERMCEPIATGRVDAVAGGVKLAPHLLRPWMNHMHRAWLASTDDYLSPENPSEMCGANMAVSRRVFDQIGGFDPELGPGVTCGGEESLLSWQLVQAGFRLGSVLDVQVEHHLASERLQYKSWVKTARLQGETRAYLVHHWFHSSVRYPELQHLYYSAKLVLRRAFSRKRLSEDEGIAPWELSYLEEIAKCACYIRERRRLANYSTHGIRRLSRDCQMATV